MRVRKEDAAGDWLVNQFWVNEPEGVAQLCRDRLALWTTQWWFDLAEGTPWETDILGAHTAATRDAAVRARVLGTAGVRAITRFSSTFDRRTRAYRVQVSLDTLYGPAELAYPR